MLTVVREDTDGVEVAELDAGFEIPWAKLLTRSHKHAYVCAFYRPNVSDALSMQNLELSLHQAVHLEMLNS